MKKTLGIICIAAAFTLFANIAPPPAHSASSSAAKIGYVNLQKALNECEDGKKAKEQLAEDAKKYADRLDARQNELKKLQDEITKKSGVWKKETRETKEAEFNKLRQDFERLYESYGQEMNEKKMKTEDEIITGLRKLVDETAAKRGYTHVFERSVGGLLYAPPEDDITDEVIKLYDKKHKPAK